jgi:hypothetical protein
MFNMRIKPLIVGRREENPSVDKKYSLVGMSRSFLWPLRTGRSCQGCAQGTY